MPGSSAATLCTHFAMLLNICIEKSVRAKVGRNLVTPLYQKGDIYDKDHYRPVSVLPCVSNLFEGFLIDQLQCHFNPLLSDHMSGFRKGHSCQSILTNFVETCKAKLDSKLFVGTILTDLSKAFDCFPGGVLISKLSMYGVHHDSCQL